MESNLFTIMQSRYPSLTASEKKVADYILKQAKDVIYMSITELAEACQVGDSSVFRFCQALDYKGYQEFKIALAHGTTLRDETPQLTSDITMLDTTSEVSEKVLHATIDALTQTHHLISDLDIQRAIDMLIKAGRIYFFGVGSSLMTAMEARSKFMRITNKTECSFDTHLQMMSASLMSKDDVAVLISYSGSTKDTIEIAKLLQEKGVPTICITRFAKSPLTDYADLILLCGANEGPLQGGSLSAKIAQLYLLDVLYVEYFKQTNKDSIDNKEVTAKSVINKMI